MTWSSHIKLNKQKLFKLKELKNNPILRSSFWTIFGYGFSQLFRLISNILLTKLLMPEMFGVMAIVNVLVIGVNMFSDIGIGPSIIQNKRGEEQDFVNTAWALQIIRGIFIFICICLVALGLWVAKQYSYVTQASVYGHPLLPGLLMVVGSSAVISGFNSTKIFVANRALSLSRLTVINLFSQVVGLCIIVYAAWLTQSIWALALGSVVTSFFDMVLPHKFLPGVPNRLCWDKAAIKDLIRFGKWIFLNTAIYFIATNGDRLILGNYLSPEILGVYSIAFMLSNLPTMIVLMLSQKVMLPALSKIYRDYPEQLKETLVNSKKWLALFSMPLTGLLIGFSQNIINFLYDETYSDAGWIMGILLMRVATDSMLIPNSVVMMAKGIPKFSTISAFLKTFFIFSALPFAFQYFGEKGAVLVVGLSGLVEAPILWYAIIKHKLFSFRVELRSVLLLLLGYSISYVVINFEDIYVYFSNSIYKIFFNINI